VVFEIIIRFYQLELGKMAILPYLSTTGCLNNCGLIGIIVNNCGLIGIIVE
jgi:hypothetical protein